MAKKKPQAAYLSQSQEMNFEAGDEFIAGLRAAREPEEQQTESRGVGRGMADVALAGGRGAVQGVRMLADLAGADNPASRGLRSVEDFIGGLRSAQAKQDDQEAAAIMKAAEGAGVLDQVIAGAKAFGMAPVSTLAQAVGTSVPTIATALIPGVGQAATGARMAAALGMGAAQGAGSVKGSIYDEVRQELLQAGASPEEAERRAAEASSYGQAGGKIATGAALGAVAGSTGMERAIGSMARGVTREAPGLARRVATGAATEALPEAAQGAQEKLATNQALHEQGFDVAPGSGVIAAATMEGLAGAGMGAAVGLPRPAVRAGDVLRAEGLQPEVGPATRALNAAVESAAKKVGAGAPLPFEMPAAATAPITTAPGAAAVAAPVGNEIEFEAAPDTGALALALADAAPAPAAPQAAAPEAQQAMQAAELLSLEGEPLTPARREQLLAEPVDLQRRRTDAADVTIDPVAAHVRERAADGTPAGRFFASEFEAGRITRADVEAQLARKPETPDERLAAAAATAKPDSPRPGDILNAQGRPFLSQMAAQRRARAEGGTAIAIEGGWSVRPKETKTDAPDAGGPAGQRAADASGGRGAGVLRDIRPANLSHGPAAAAGEGDAGNAAAMVRPGRVEPDALLTPDGSQATADTEAPPAQASAPARDAPSQPGAADAAARPPALEADGVAGETTELPGASVATEAAATVESAAAPAKVQEQRKTAGAAAAPAAPAPDAPAPKVESDYTGTPQQRWESLESEQRKAALKAIGWPAGVPLNRMARLGWGLMTEGQRKAAGQAATKGVASDAALSPMPKVEDVPLKLAVAAHSGTSHSPDERGAQEQRRFRAALQNAWEAGTKAAGTDAQALARVTEVFKDVAEGYRARVLRELEARGRVISPMITGPARFPVERNRKRLETERKRSEEAREYLQRGSNRMLRAAADPTDTSPEAEVERIQLNLSEREESQAGMKAANAALRRGDDAALEDLGFSAAEIAALKKPDAVGRIGFPDYKLTNNNAEIHRLRDRLAAAEARQTAAAAGPKETVRAGVRVVEDAQDDRLRLFFDDKPDEAMRQELKSSAFKWSPKAGAWQRQLTDNARRAARQFLAKHFPADTTPAAPAPATDVASPATHQDPGQSPEPATAAVVSEAIAGAPESRGLSRTEMRAEALRLIDAAIDKAPSSAAVDALIGIQAPVTERGKKVMRGFRAFTAGAPSSEGIVVEARKDRDGRWNVTNESFDGSGTGKKVHAKLGTVEGTPAAAREQLRELMRRLLPDGSVGQADTVSIKVPGDGEFRVVNSKERLAEFRRKVETSAGFKEKQSAPESPRVNGLGMRKDPGSQFGVERGSGGTKAAIEGMIDEGDAQAAVDFAAAKGVVLADTLKGDKARLAKVADLAPSTDTVRARRGGAARAGVDLASAKALADQMAAEGLVKLNVVQSSSDLPQRLQRALKRSVADGEVRGVYFRSTDEVWMVADNIRGAEEFVSIALHESFHRGFHRLVPNGRALLHEMWRTNQALRKATADQVRKHGLADKSEAIEEALAVMAEAGTVRELKGWAKLLETIRSWLGKVARAAGVEMTWTDDMIADLVAGATREGLMGGVHATRAGGALASRGDLAGERALQALSENDGLFALPRLEGATVSEIAFDLDPTIKVTSLPQDKGRERWRVTLPNGGFGDISIRKPNKYGPNVYGFDLQDGEAVNLVTERPGDNPDDVDTDTQDVWIDVSQLKPGQNGDRIYAIAGGLAHNTGRIFIGDPNGLSDLALRRRAENMLSLALRYGTTNFLGPHPDQIKGSAKLGVPPLRWVYGDDVGNAERLIAVNVKAVENQFSEFANWDFDASTGRFSSKGSDAPGNADHGLHGLPGQGLPSPSDRGGARADGGSDEAETPSSRTLARGVIWQALSRQEGGDGQGGGQRNGLLARLAGLGGADSTNGQLKGLFSRVDPDAARSPITLQQIQQRATDLMRTKHSFNWWHRTVGTQYHKAQIDADYKRVYDAAQAYLHDTSTFANDPADLAPDLLPQLKGVRDLKRNLGLSKDDRTKLGAAVFDGTLKFVRDDSGQVREAGDEDTGGVIWTPDELRTRYGFNDGQVKLYQQFRAATDRSLDTLVATDVARLMGGDLPIGMREMISAGDLGRFQGMARAFTLARVQTAVGPAEQAKWTEIEQQVREKFERIDELKARGYAPLQRFGRYTVDVVGADGQREFFGLYETEREANRAAREFRALDGTAAVSQGLLSEEAYRQFSGVTPETLELFAEVAGVEKSELFQEYLRRAKNNRSALKRLIHRKGIAGYSEDSSRVLSSFLLSNARAASGNLHMGEISQAVAAVPREKGDVLDDAVRLQAYVQTPQEEAQAIRGLLFAQYLGGSVASAMVNMTQPLMMTFPYLSQFGGPAAAARRLAAAVKPALGSYDRDSDLGRALRQAEKEGIVSPQELHQLQAEASVALAAHPALRRMLFAWGALFSAAEQFNRRVSFIAAFETAKATGQADPAEFAARAVDETQGVYNKGNKPRWARGAVGATVFTFKQYSVSYMEFLKRLPTRERTLALAVLLLAAGAQGLPGMDDLDDLIDTLGQGLGYDTNAELWKTRVLSAALGDGPADFVLRGFSALPGFPLDVAGRLGLGNLVPGTGLMLKSKVDKAGEVTEALGPAASLAAGVVKAVPALASGNVGGAVDAVGAKAIKDLRKALEMYQTGEYRDTKGRKVTDASATDAAVKALGFQPAHVAADSRRTQLANQQVALARVTEAEFADAIAQARVAGDREAEREARTRLAKWNENNPDSRIVITLPQIARRARELRVSRDDRFVRSAPKEMRGSVAAILD